MAHSKRTLQAMLYVLKYLTSHPCIDCGEADPVVLDFDHRQEKNFTIGDALTRGTDTSVIAKEVLLCDVRCANCHRKKHCNNSYRRMSISELEAKLGNPLISRYQPRSRAERVKYIQTLVESETGA